MPAPFCCFGRSCNCDIPRLLTVTQSVTISIENVHILRQRCSFQNIFAAGVLNPMELPTIFAPPLGTPLNGPARASYVFRFRHPSCSFSSVISHQGALQELIPCRRKMKMRKNQKGFSLIELLIVVAIILIIAAIAIPNLLRAKMAANEASAVASLRTLNTTIVAYSTTYSTDPPSISNLGPSNGATPTSTDADLLDGVLAPAS